MHRRNHLGAVSHHHTIIRFLPALRLGNHHVVHIEWTSDHNAPDEHDVVDRLDAANANRRISSTSRPYASRPFTARTSALAVQVSVVHFHVYHSIADIIPTHWRRLLLLASHRRDHHYTSQRVITITIAFGLGRLGRNHNGMVEIDADDFALHVLDATANECEVELANHTVGIHMNVATSLSTTNEAKPTKKQLDVVLVAEQLVVHHVYILLLVEKVVLRLHDAVPSHHDRGVVSLLYVAGIEGDLVSEDICASLRNTHTHYICSGEG